HNNGIRNFELHQNYPNPFNPVTKIKYSVPQNSYVTLKVYNILGQEVATLFEGVRNPGNYTAYFRAEGLSSGVYLYQLKSESYSETKKLMILK
ncbi:MAG: T9SS type A sorting domain-containing protein, partial [Calditrichaceae bacterium]